MYLVCSEVDYALNADKAVIPIRIHRSYLLDGWLSTALANHSLLNIADTEDFDAGVMQLLQRVSAVTGFVATSDTGNMFTFAQQISNIFHYFLQFSLLGFCSVEFCRRCWFK